MLPAGFEPASEARKAPILDRTRLRERNAGLVPGAINAFGTPCTGNVETGNYMARPALDAPMRRSRPTMTEFAFFVSGVLIILLGWFADLLGILELNSNPTTHGSASTLPLRLFLTMFGVAFAAIGVAFENFPRILEDGEAAKRYLVAFLFLADGSFHLYALNDHLGDTFASSFFAAFSGLQIAAAFVIPYARRRLDPAWLAITAFLIAAYIATRIFAVWPIGPIEEVDALGIISKLVEVLTVLMLLSIVQDERTARKSAKSASAGSR